MPDESLVKRLEARLRDDFSRDLLRGALAWRRLFIQKGVGRLPWAAKGDHDYMRSAPPIASQRCVMAGDAAPHGDARLAP
jgi:hypothetical protein